MKANYAVVAGGQCDVTLAIHPVPGGERPALFSYGVRLVAEGTGRVEADKVVVPPDLDFTGFFPGATVDLSSGVTGVKGNTQFAAGEFRGYSGSVLATFTLKGLEAGMVNLGLELFRTVGSSEAVFVTTDAEVLDDSITFGTATLTVAPPPRLEVVRLDADTIGVRYGTVSGLRYSLWRSENMLDWALAAETVGQAGAVESFEFSTRAGGSAYFRLEAVPDGR